MRKLNLAFDRPLQLWDGFGFNYVETAQTRDYRAHPQDYGGYELLPAAERDRLVEMVYGRDGLRPGLVKCFLDPFHQEGPADAGGSCTERLNPGSYDHLTTTRSMLDFLKRGLEAMHSHGAPLSGITTLYGPPAWMTRQKFLRGRDLDPAHRLDLVKYVAAFALFLREEVGLPMRAVSLHNEGEDWMRWPADGAGAGEETHDYNLYWPPEAVCEALPLMRRVLDANGLPEVAAAPGETSNWMRFHQWGYADALARDPAAMAALGLIVSHGFWSSYAGQWNADHRPTGIDQLRTKRPELHAWTTSSGWGRQFLGLIWEVQQSIYVAGLNGFIPWAGVQRDKLWKGGDPNPQTAFRVDENGRLTVEKEYYVYKHLCRAGGPGTRVVPCFVNDSEIVPLAFSGAGTGQPDAFVLANLGQQNKPLLVEISGQRSQTFAHWRTTMEENWAPLGTCRLPGTLTLPAGSVSTFIAD